MRTSEDIKEITKALVAFHSEVGRITKDGTNPHLKNRYATIDQIIEEIRPILADKGLFIMQLPTNTEGGEIQMVTRLYHISGQWMESPSLKIKVDRNNAQGIGSAITYARRYSLTSFLGLNTGEDDDGHAASGDHSGQAQQFRGKQQAGKGQTKQTNPLTEQKRAILVACHEKGLTDNQAAKLVTTLLEKDPNTMTLEEAQNVLEEIKTKEFIDLIDMIGERISQGQIKAIHATANEMKISESERRGIIQKITNRRTDSSKYLTKTEASKVIERLKQKAEAKQALMDTLGELKQAQ